ncbi:MAG: T9SS type A sorting domain-containing protein [Saprospiraceae bacterium]|nr:T9SS type A sorting domain-containing protein [Saprospiraceae bacterium]
MSKQVFWAVCLLHFLFAQPLKSEPFENNSGPVCPLPPPPYVSIVHVDAGSLSISWPQVANALVYRVNIYDQTDQESLPAIYTSNNYLDIDGLDTELHTYTIGVSASACTDPPDFGQETTTLYEPGFIIIVDEIVQLNLNCQPPNISGSFSAGYLQTLSLPMNTEGSNVIHATRAHIAATNGPTKFVDFLIWVDCFQQIRFYQISAKGVERVKDGKVIHYKYGNNLQFPFIDITKLSCDINICTVAIKYFVACTGGFNSCSLPNQPETCGGKIEFGSNSHLRLNNNIPPLALFAPQDKKHQHTNEEESLKVSPNPFQNDLQMEYRLQDAGMVNIRLYNSMGTLLSEPIPPCQLDAGVYLQTLTLGNDLPPGMYFLVLQSENKRIAVPIVKK